MKASRRGSRGQSFSASMDRGLWTQGIAHGGPGRRWNHSSVCHPDLISWCLGFVKEGARAAGRDPEQIEVMSAAPVWVSDDLAVARERVRWFPALVSNHVMDLIRQYKPEDLPPRSLPTAGPGRLRLLAPLRGRKRTTQILFLTR